MTLYRTKTRRWLKAIEIAKVLFEEEGYHLTYLDELSGFIRRKTVYSPKIGEELIPALYRMARSKRIPMTKLVNGILMDYLRKSALVEGGTTSHEGKKQMGRFPEGQGTGLHGDGA